MRIKPSALIVSLLLVSSTLAFTVSAISMSTATEPVDPWAGIVAEVDFDPDTLNLKSQGKWITAYISVVKNGTPISGDIVLESVTLEVGEGVEPELDEKYSFVDEPDVKDYTGDGIPDLMVKFDRQAVQDEVSPGDEVELTVTGQVNGEDFDATGTIRVI